MYTLVGKWEEATARTDALAAQIDEFRRANVTVPDAMLESLAVAEHDVLLACRALANHGDLRTPVGFLH